MLTQYERILPGDFAAARFAWRSWRAASRLRSRSLPITLERGKTGLDF
jgi:hypothetical protein